MAKEHRRDKRNGSAAANSLSRVSKPRNRESKAPAVPPSQVGQAIALVATYALLLGGSLIALYRVPAVLPDDAPLQLFSEGRALNTVRDLAEGIGPRLVGTPGIELAVQYLLERCHELKLLAEETRPDLIVEVHREQVTGATTLDFVHTSIANAYNNLTNVVLKISPKAAKDLKGVLVNAHFDTVFGTSGASDCASCVAVALEVARVLVADPGKTLAAPALFLFNGGEELVLLGAHGFMNQSRHASQLAAFINLESTGPGGPDVMFQASGNWPVEAYGRVAPIPRASVLGQDLFDAHLVVLDTDFRMFSFRQKGTLPGIDIAHILDGSAYHTSNDNFARLRPGVIQGTGDNALAVLLEFSREVVERQREDATSMPALEAEGSIFVDFISLGLVRYPFSWGKGIHTLPLVAVVGLMASALVSRQAPDAVRSAVVGVSASLLSFLFACALPGLLGHLRVFLSGKPLAWFSSLPKAYLMYGPASLAGLLLPFAVLPLSALGGLTQRARAFATVQAVLSAVMTHAGARSAFGPAVWAFSSLASLLVSTEGPLQVAWGLLCAAPAVLLLSPTLTVLPAFVMEHLTLAGARGPMWAGDAAAGAVLGFGLASSVGFLAAFLASRLGPSLKKFVAALLLVSVASATWMSLTGNPYSESHVKRVFLQHHHSLAPDGNILESKWVVGGLDMTPVERLLPLVTNFSRTTDRDFQALYPVTRLLEGVTVEAPRPDKTKFPYKKIAIVLTDQYSHSGTSRLHLEMRLPRPAWGTLNVTGPVKAWSFTDELPSTLPLPNGCVSHVVRFAGDQGAQLWPFWIEVQGEGALRLELGVLFHDQTPALRDFSKQFPPWTHVAAFTAFQADFEF